MLITQEQVRRLLNIVPKEKNRKITILKRRRKHYFIFGGMKKSLLLKIKAYLNVENFYVIKRTG